MSLIIDNHTPAHEGDGEEIVIIEEIPDFTPTVDLIFELELKYYFFPIVTELPVEPRRVIPAVDDKL